MEKTAEVQDSEIKSPDIKSYDIETLKFEHVFYQFEEGPVVFKDLIVDIPINNNIFVTGPAGSGHSTFLKILAGLIQPISGRYLINGHNTTDMSFEEFFPFRMKMGYSFDFGGLFANRTLLDNLTLPLLYHKRSTFDEADAIAKELAVEFGFERQSHQRPALVSGGLRKLICVLRAFIMHPQMVVMDDPFTGIGMDASRKLVRLIQERRSSGELKHVFMTSRDEVWPHWLGCDSLFLEHGTVRIEERKAA